MLFFFAKAWPLGDRSIGLTHTTLAFAQLPYKLHLTFVFHYALQVLTPALRARRMCSRRLRRGLSPPLPCRVVSPVSLSMSSRPRRLRALTSARLCVRPLSGPCLSHSSFTLFMSQCLRVRVSAIFSAICFGVSSAAALRYRADKTRTAGRSLGLIGLRFICRSISPRFLLFSVWHGS